MLPSSKRFFYQMCLSFGSLFCRNQRLINAAVKKNIQSSLKEIIAPCGNLNLLYSQFPSGLLEQVMLKA